MKSKEQGQEEMARLAGQPPGRTRRKRKRSGGKQALFFLAVAAVFLFAFAKTLFFNLEFVSVQQAEEELVPYTDAEIADASGILLGENMFLRDYSKNKAELEKKLPYIGNATFQNSYPDELVISVSATTAFGYISIDDSRFLVDKQFKVLEQLEAEEETNLPEFLGFEPSLFEIGKILEENNEKNLQSKVDIIANIVDNYVIEDISYIDIADLKDIRIGYLGRFVIWMGDGSQVAEKASFVKKVVETQLVETDKGVLDISDAEECYFIRNR